MRKWRAISKFMLAFFLISAGSMHFAKPDFFIKIMPPYLPFPEQLVLISGVCEILLGILLLIPRCSRLAAWGIIALLVAVFPANVYLYQNQGLLPASPIIHLLRLPLQGLSISFRFNVDIEWRFARMICFQNVAPIVLPIDGYLVS